MDVKRVNYNYRNNIKYLFIFIFFIINYCNCIHLKKSFNNFFHINYLNNENKNSKIHLIRQKNGKLASIGLNIKNNFDKKEKTDKDKINIIDKLSEKKNVKTFKNTIKEDINNKINNLYKENLSKKNDEEIQKDDKIEDNKVYNKKEEIILPVDDISKNNEYESLYDKKDNIFLKIINFFWNKKNKKKNDKNNKTNNDKNNNENNDRIKNEYENNEYYYENLNNMNNINNTNNMNHINNNDDKKNEDNEINYLLKALDTGKFPNYCIIKNIDENIDNFDIYLSKEKMKELNLSDGFTVLLKGKKKREMLGIVREKKNLEKNFVIISNAMKKNLRLLNNDIIKIYLLTNVPKINQIVLSPFSDTIPNISLDEIIKNVITPYFKNAYKPVYINNNIYINYKNREIEFKILKIINNQQDQVNNQNYGYITNNTQIIVGLSEKKEQQGIYINREEYEEQNDEITYEDLGGIKKQLNKIRELIELPLKYPEIFMSIGISAPKGVLMHGIPGTGKTSIAKAIANESNAYCYIINGPEIMSKHIGESEHKLRKIFKKANEKNPCIIFIDEIDSIANKRNKSNNELEKRVVSQLLTLMDGLKKNNNVLVLGATNRPNAIDPALRRFGRFDREIEIPVPDEEGRYEILLTKTKKMKLDKDVNLRKIAKECHGYVGADLAQLCFEAAMQCIRENIYFLDLDEEDFIEFMKINLQSEEQNNINKNIIKNDNINKNINKNDNINNNINNKNDNINKRYTIPRNILNKLTIKQKHFQYALNICNPSSLRERHVQIPTVTWNDIGGMEKVKQQLKQTILYPLEYKHLYNKFNSNYNKGILLYGPPGCGKTLLAKAIANECKANFISVKGPELLTMWFGESEANVRDLFDKARAASPCIIFFDEIDSLAKERNNNNNNDASDRVINQILTEIDGINEKKTIFIIAATNRPDILDKALTRPGRLDKLIYISLPDYKSRYNIFKAILKNTPLNKDIDIHEMAKKTEGFSGADITNLCQSAVNEAIKETIYLIEQKKKKTKQKMNINEILNYDPVPYLSKKHFDLAFKNARISIQPEDVLKYENFKKKLTLNDNITK